MISDELLKIFVRRLTRMVCKDPLQIVIIEKLVEHGALSVAQLARLLGEECSKARLRRLCQLLLQERILTMHGGDALGGVHEQDRPHWRRTAADDDAMWYIDYPDVINAVHFRLLEIELELQQRDTSFESRKIFSCPRCGSQWALLDVVQNSSPEGFLCEACSKVLQEAIDTAAADDVAIRREINFFAGMLAELEGHVATPIDLAKKAREADSLFV